ncbi:three-prime repair exonuclease 1-like [Leguminivora glycinivorella]|uniref:three-prime repair exonuclease 1-like n=1 Tax=Leguminivora glycinivorella TaxID=1035111 RepID=UPI00200F10B8|nr:three-prime repair exonuclease 1-like [Leguminivora glycinivorella]
MAPIATYVFFDLETTGLPRDEFNKTKITELCMVAVKREHVLYALPGRVPRVLHKLTRCFNPGKRITEGSSEITGLDNFLLEHESYFDIRIFNMIDNFLNTLTKPACFITHNGRNFDFPILKRQLDMLNVKFSDDLLCADSLDAFSDILEEKKAETIVVEAETVDEVDLAAENCLSMQAVNEVTPKQVKLPPKRPPNPGKAKQRLPFSEKRLKESYKLPDIYERVLRRRAVDAHRAETDCMLSLEIAVALSKEFTEWVDAHHHQFSEVSPMTPGIKLGS